MGGLVGMDGDGTHTRVVVCDGDFLGFGRGGGCPGAASRDPRTIGECGGVRNRDGAAEDGRPVVRFWIDLRAGVRPLPAPPAGGSSAR